MSATIIKGPGAFSLGSLSYINSSYEEQPAVQRAPRKRPALARFHAWRQRRKLAVELALMTDRELADIGLSRTDLSRVFDPAFAASRARDGGYIAF